MAFEPWILDFWMDSVSKVEVFVDTLKQAGIDYRKARFLWRRGNKVAISDGRRTVILSIVLVSDEWTMTYSVEDVEGVYDGEAEPPRA